MKKLFYGVLRSFMLFGVIILAGCTLSSVKATTSSIIAISNVRVFDGESLIDDRIVLINGANILAVSGEIPPGAPVIDGHGATRMPGLIDSHVHTDIDGLRDALKFGVTTELAMNGHSSKAEHKKISQQNDIADMRTPEMSVTAPGGHSTQYMNNTFTLLMRWFMSYPPAVTADAEIKFVNKQIAAGADYIKIIIEDGTVVGFPNLLQLSDEAINAAAHVHGKMAIAHITTAAGASRAVAAGVDGLAHMFFDNPQAPELMDEIASSGMFVTPTLGQPAQRLATTPPRWLPMNE
jgi:imidazolonepropionase-like amidohydrolase